MRYAIVAMLLATTASPAFASTRHAGDAEMARAVQKLNDPALRHALSGTMGAMMEAMLDLRIDKIQAAMGPLGDPGAPRSDGPVPRTLRDVVGRDDPHFSEHMAAETDRAVGMMGNAASGMAQMLPELRDLAEKMSRAMEKSMAKIPAS